MKSYITATIELQEEPRKFAVFFRKIQQAAMQAKEKQITLVINESEMSICIGKATYCYNTED